MTNGQRSRIALETESSIPNGQRLRIALRHAVSIALLPGMVAVAGPAWLLAQAGDTRWADGSATQVLARVGGLMLISAGAGLFAWCVALFASVGRGTLAPWDPTRQLVTVGPYRLSRNPMIAGVALALAGQALYHGSRWLTTWAVAFMAINHIYFLLVEEPSLRRRFGEAYCDYATRVPRWLRWPV